MTECTCLCTLAKLTPMFGTSKPKTPALRIVSARFAAAKSPFDGTQPVLRQPPPILLRSTKTGGTPNAAAAAATDKPPGPPPRTQISGFSISVMPLPVPSPTSNSGTRPPAPIFQHHWQQREQAKRDKRSDQ